MLLDIDMSRKNKTQFSIAFPSVVLALVFVFSPYLPFMIESTITLRVSDLLLVLAVLICVFNDRIMIIKKSFLLKWIAIFFILNFIAVAFNGFQLDSITSFKFLLFILGYSVLYSIIWQKAESKVFFDTVEIICVITSIIVIIQFIAGYMGVSVWNGELPFLNYAGHWSGYLDPFTKNVRPNGLFQEASYVGMYTSIGLVAAIKRSHFRRMILFILSMVLSSSLISLLLAFFIPFYLLFLSKNSEKKIRRRISIIVIVFLVALVILYNSNIDFKTTVDYLFLRISNISIDLQSTTSNSANLRLLGNIDCFHNMQPFQKVFGLGESQYISYFAVDEDYTNNIIRVLLNYGIIGLTAFVIMNITLYRAIEKEYRVFFWIYLFISASDAIWFNTHFFYLITPIVFGLAKMSTSHQTEHLGRAS